jgi:uncharacterized membrane protein
MQQTVMNFNLIAYLIYGVLSYLITVRIGLIFYRNGIHFIRAELSDEQLSASVNNLLLTCYYLTNLGYVTLVIWLWERIYNLQGLVESLCEKIGFIVLSLGLLHFMNMLIIYVFSRNKIFTK